MSALARRPRTDRLRETAQVEVGDLVRTGGNFHPHYHVIALTEDRAWIRDTQHGIDHVVPLDRCTKI